MAAGYTATAAWSALDAKQTDRAYALLGKALHLAGMGQDPVVELRVWNSYAMPAHQRAEHVEAVDSAQAAQATAITAIVRDRIGDSADAEAASHKALGPIPTQFRRNRALATTRLALAQLHQRDIDQACATASTAFTLMSGSPIPGRMRSLLGDYCRDLITLAPDAAVAREWGDRFRTEWSRA